jgi:hypothetical protein
VLPFVGRGLAGQTRVELVERVNLGDRHEVHPPGIADEPLDEALLMTLARRAVRLWWKARASSRMLDPSRKWAYRIRSISTILINLSSRTAAASTTGTVLVGWGVKVVLL